MRIPVVGITTHAERAQFGAWDVPTAFVPLSYVWAIEEAGGRPLLVPPSLEAIEETLDALDGIVLSGGADLDPALWGEEPHEATFGVDPLRDSAELALLRAALDRDLPVLAVCRGSQVLNVALGGDLEQHIPDRLGHDGHKVTPGTFAEHPVEMLPGTRLHHLIGDGAHVRSHHHQGYRRLGEGLREAARAEDGTIEAIEDPARRFAIGVLWHPEAGEDRRLFEALVAEARSYRARAGALEADR
jgi:putative glutamine amidotransferase